MAVTEGPQHRIVIEGPAATVRLGYQHAATLGPWRVEGDHFSAAVDRVDTFRITQSPLTLEISYPTGPPTRRTLADVQVSAGRLSARLLRNR